MAKTHSKADRPRRKRVASAHFAIAAVNQSAVNQPALSQSTVIPAQLDRSVNGSKPGESVVQTGHLLMAIPKRLLKRAVDRNIVRRAARQAWRDQVLTQGPTSTALIRMTAKPAGFEQSSRPQRKKQWREELIELMDRYAQQ